MDKLSVPLKRAGMFAPLADTIAGPSVTVHWFRRTSVSLGMTKLSVAPLSKIAKQLEQISGVEIGTTVLYNKLSFTKLFTVVPIFQVGGVIQ